MKRTIRILLAISGLAVGGAASGADSPIVVDTVAELQAALVPANAGRTIHVVAGDYALTQALVVPNGTRLEGEGVLDVARGGLPDESGFAPPTLTRIRATASVVGDVVTLGDGSTIRGLQIEDVARPLPGGNVVMVASRAPGDFVAAEIVECVLVNPNASGVAPNGPNGRALSVLARNLQAPNLPPHNGSTVAVKLSRSILNSVGSGIFAINFAAESTVTVDVERSIIGGGLDANGGVSRPDQVFDSGTTIRSRRNWYRGPGVQGWILLGGSGPPITVLGPIGPTVRNTLQMHSIDDRITGFSVAVMAAGSRRYFGLPFQGANADNRLELTMHGTTMSSSEYDFDIWGAGVFAPGVPSGDDNTVRLHMRRVTGSGMPNSYGVAFGPDHMALPPELAGSGNGVEVVGSLKAFEHANPGVDPAPPEFFTARGKKGKKK